MSASALGQRPSVARALPFKPACTSINVREHFSSTRHASSQNPVHRALQSAALGWLLMGGEDEKKDASQYHLNVSLIDRLEVSGGGGCLEQPFTGLS